MAAQYARRSIAVPLAALRSDKLEIVAVEQPERVEPPFTRWKSSVYARCRRGTAASFLLRKN